jgi:hypothetical protein
MAMPAAAMGAASGTGYLPRVGPSPLRLQTVVERFVPPDMPPLAENDDPPQPEVTSPAPDPMSNAFKLEDYLTPNASLWTGIVENLVGSARRSSEPENPPQEPATSVSSANDIVVVTPQMLVEYFRPGASGTNGGVASVTVPVDFTPPTTHTTPQSSRATYMSP